MTEKDIDNIVWFIPFKKARHSVRELLKTILNNHSGNSEIAKEVDSLKEISYDIQKSISTPPHKLLNIMPIGHYESPYPPEEELISNYAKFDWKQSSLEEVNLNTEAQLKLYKNMEPTLLDFYLLKEDEKNNRFHNNEWFGYGCALHIYGIIRHIKPKRIIEIGSGYSTAIILDVNKKYFNNEIEITCIEPNPERLYALLTKEEKNNLNIIEDLQQNIALEVFQKLEENDLLFIDSSHVSRPFSDVNRQFFQILPSLNKNVYIHMHDIHHPFEYPKVWTLDQRRAYNEAYMLRAFLQYNNVFDIILHPHYLHTVYPDKINKDIHKIGAGGSMYLKKVK